MKPRKEEVVRRLVQDWLVKAGQDFSAADILLSQELPLLYPSCFHSQQAAKKYLKAFLTWRQVEFPKNIISKSFWTLSARLTNDLRFYLSLQ